VKDVIRRIGSNVPQLEQALQKVLQDQPRVSNPDGQIQVSAELGRLLNLTEKAAKQQGDQYVSSEIFLLVALEDKGAAGQALKAAGLD
ncbi:Clp protease N-terminal domain-containing protein, partial [Wenyingzhuangia sp. 1_MG-2023]|nr:Clp protease N-terminal domain-containing protein [Wenyingzhuangia sp. 1_MG-2023]